MTRRGSEALDQGLDIAEPVLHRDDQAVGREHDRVMRIGHRGGVVTFTAQQDQIERPVEPRRIVGEDETARRCRIAEEPLNAQPVARDRIEVTLDGRAA